MTEYEVKKLEDILKRHMDATEEIVKNQAKILKRLEALENAPPHQCSTDLRYR